MTEESSEIKIARLEERLIAANTATRLAADALEAWKASANEWRQALTDQRGTFITRPELAAWLTIGLTLLGFILKYTK